MKHCKYCNVNVDTNENYCPLCYNSLEGENTETITEFYLKKTKNDTTHKTNIFLYKLFLMITLAIDSFSIFANIFTYKSSPLPWSGVVVVSTIYVWILVAHTIISKRSTFEKIFLQVIGAISVVVAMNHILQGHWITDYVIPSIQLAVTFTVAFITLLTKNKQKIVLPFFVTYLLSFIASLILVLIKADAFMLLSDINMIACGICICGTLLFGFKTLKNDFVKKFHL